MKNHHVGPLKSRANTMDWQRESACLGEDPDLFGELLRWGCKGSARARDVRRIQRALAICSRCPVRALCLAFGKAERGSGVYGGQLLKKGEPCR